MLHRIHTSFLSAFYPYVFLFPFTDRARGERLSQVAIATVIVACDAAGQKQVNLPIIYANPVRTEPPGLGPDWSPVGTDSGTSDQTNFGTRKRTKTKRGGKAWTLFLVTSSPTL